ncbi:MAG: hypothetical protein ABJD11_11385 [Gemmatimonadota bacterium]
MSTTSSGPVNAFHQAIEVERQAPIYFVAVSVWRLVSDSLTFVRLFSTLCILLSLVVLDRLGGLLGISNRYWSLGLLAGLTPQMLWAASEARSYALLILLVSLALYTSALLWLREGAASRGVGVAYVASASLAVLTFYYAAFVIAGQALTNLIRHDRRAFWVWPLLAVLVLPWTPVVAHELSLEAAAQHAAGAIAGAPASPRLGSAIRSTPSAVAGSIFRSTPALLSGWGLMLVCALLTLLAVARVRSRSPVSPAELTAIVIATLVVTALSLLRLRSADIVQARHWSPATPVLLLLVALVISRLAGRQARSLGSVAAVAILAGATAQYQARHSKEDWRDVAQWIAERAGPGEPIVFYGPNGSRPFLFYYRGTNPLVVESEAPTDSLIRKFHGIGALWLITRNGSTLDSARAETSRRFAQTLRIDTTRTFPGISVSRLTTARE